MKTIELIKEFYAKSIGYYNWDDLDYNVDDSKDFDDHWKNVCLIAQKECLKIASENAEADHNPINISWVPVVIKGSITNENNIIK